MYLFCTPPSKLTVEITACFPGTEDGKRSSLKRGVESKYTLVPVVPVSGGTPGEKQRGRTSYGIEPKTTKYDEAAHRTGLISDVSDCNIVNHAHSHRRSLVNHLSQL